MTEASSTGSAPPITRFIWDLTYACPLRCGHCYSESGRRPARTLPRDAMLQVVEVIAAARPERVSLSGGEPLLARWWAEAARALDRAGVPVTVFTSGWTMDAARAEALADSAASVAVSIDGPCAEIHDRIRGRKGSFDRAVAALEALAAVKHRRLRERARCFTFGIDYTVTRTGNERLEEFVGRMTRRVPELDFVRFGAVVPEGLAQEEAFASELLDDAELADLGDAEKRLDEAAAGDARVSVTDARYFLPGSPLSHASEGIAHIEPDGQLRAVTNYEAKVGSILDEPLETLWARAIAWRNDPFVVEQLASVRTFADWARATRALDRRYGSEHDKARIARRTAAAA